MRIHSLYLAEEPAKAAAAEEMARYLWMRARVEGLKEALISALAGSPLSAGSKAEAREIGRSEDRSWDLRLTPGLRDLLLDLRSEHLPELDAKLVEAVDVPEEALHGRAVFE